MSQSLSGKISVIVAAYNAEKTLRESVGSILAQTYRDIEVLIVDDKSKDGTLVLARQIATEDARVQVIESIANGGPARARNQALDKASGDWIAIVDSDDLIVRDRFASMLEAATTTGADIVFDNLFYVTPHNGAENLYIPMDKAVFGELTLETFIASHRRSVDIPNLGFLKPLIRMEIVRKAGLRYEPALKIGEDAMLIMDLMALGAKACLLKEAYYRYHRHDGSISAVQSTGSITAITDGYEVFLKRYQGKLTEGAASVMRMLIADNRARIKVGMIVDNLSGENILAGVSGLLKSPQLAVPVARLIAGKVKRALRSR